MDVERTEKDGLRATEEICADYPKARIVIVTDNGDANMQKAAKKALAAALSKIVFWNCENL